MLKTLAGVKVVEMSIGAAGPSAGKILSEYGAEVIVVEPPTGTTTRWMTEYYDFWQCGKKSIPLNLKDPKGMEALIRLVKGADVFLTNYRVKALNKLGLDYDSLKKINSRLIYALMTGWGESGPLKDDAGYDVTCFWAKSGYLRDLAEKGTVCVAPQGVGDTAAGANMSGAICAALYNREKTGKGCKLSTSLFAHGIFYNNFQSICAQFGTEYPKSRLAPQEALVNTYPCKDGYILFFINQFNRQFAPLLTAIGRSDLVGDPRWTCIEDTKGEKAPELRAILDEAFSKFTTDEAVTILKGVDVAVEKCYGSLEAISDPQVTENNYVFDWKLSSGPHAGETIKMPTSPIFFDDESSIEDFQRGPHLGEHTAEVLKAIGYSDAEVKDMVDKKIAIVE